MGMGSRVSRSMAKLKDSQRQKSDDRFAERFAHQWSQIRADRRPEEPPRIDAGPSNFATGRVPYGVDLAAAWAWRFLVIVAAGYVVLQAISIFELILLPLVIALFLAALGVPLVALLHRLKVPRGLAAFLVVVGGLGFIALLLTLAGQQVAQGANDLSKQVVDGIEQIRNWLKTGPLQASDSQINGYLQNIQNGITSGNNRVVSRVTEVGTAVSHILAGFFIILFATYFFLADGVRIWAWVVRIFPRAARSKADSSGRVAWTSLTRFVRATVLVAFTDAVGVMIVAAVLKVPFVAAIGVLVFIGAFIPMIGALLSGSVAVLVALVAHGPIVALVMLGGVVAVQQLEAHVLQPFLLGRFVSVHPLGVIMAIGAGVLVAGVPGALVAVPLAAALNAVVLHLSEMSQPDPVEDRGPEPPPATVTSGP
ncbi:MAG: AI-2E family transporter [Nocardioidaceae bacterium]